MMQLTEEQRKALAGLCRIEIKRWKAASESDPNMRYMVELMETALAGLTAEPIGRVDRGEVSDSNEYPDARVVCLHEQADWENFQDGTELFLRPAPAINLAELVPDAEHIHNEFDDWREGWNACRAAGYQVEE
jgi:hypothetical protein